MELLYHIPVLRRLWLLAQSAVFHLLYGQRIGNKVRLFGYPLFSLAPGAQVRFGKRVMLISAAYFSEPGIGHPVVIRLLNGQAKLTIGDNVGISGGGICVQTEVRIGNGVQLGAGAFITDTDFHPLALGANRRSHENALTAPVVIDDNVFIGMNSIILKGVHIGQNSIVGAGSVVAKSIPPNEVWAGNPAKFIKKLS